MVNKINGKRLDNPLLHYFMEQELGSYPKKYLNKVWNDVQPKIEGLQGRVIIYGTGGDMGNNDSLLELFKNSKDENK